MTGISKIILALTAGFALSGCVSHTSKTSQSDPAAIEAAKIALHTDSQFCQAEGNYALGDNLLCAASHSRRFASQF